MPAVSGSPTQVSTSVLTAAQLATTPDDAFEEGDLACVSSLWPNSMFRLRRTPFPGTPDNVHSISSSSYGYWELLNLSNMIVLRSDPTSDKSQSVSVQVSDVLTGAAPALLYSFTPPPSSTLRVYASVNEILDDGSHDYGVDLVASFRVDALGAVVARYPSTVAAELPAGVVVVQPVLSTDGVDIYLQVAGRVGETWLAGANLSIVQRSTTP